MLFSYTKNDFDCEYIGLNPLIFKSVYTRHNVSSDVIDGHFEGWILGWEEGLKGLFEKREISLILSV